MVTSELKKCPHCQEEINKKANKCPHCQTDLRWWFARHPIITIIIVLFALPSFLQGLTLWGNKWTNNTQTTAINNYDPNLEAQKKLIATRERLAKIVILSSKVEDEYWFEHLVVKVRNDTWGNIDALTIRASFTNNFWEIVKKRISWDTYFDWIAQKALNAWKTAEYDWQLSLFENATKINSIEVTSMHYVDTNEKVSIE